MMPVDGIYIKRTISKNQFVSLIKNASEIKSSIGYDTVTEIIKELTDIDVEVDRGVTLIDENYNIVGLTLDYRVDPQDKGYSKPTVDDYIYFIAFYKKEDENKTTEISQGVKGIY